MNLLALDTSSENISLAISKQGKIVFDLNRRIKFGASHLPAYIDRALKKIRLDPHKIDIFVLGAGPGSFTGLRISFSIIKALALVTKKPVISLSSFYSCAYGLSKKSKKIAVISDARKNLVYSIFFKVKDGILKIDRSPALSNITEVVKNNKDHLFCTYDSNLRKQVQEIACDVDFWPKDIYPRASSLIKLAAESGIGKKIKNIDKLEPLYLHPKTCQVRSKP